MAFPKAVSIVGYKDAGKTLVVEAVVRGLVERGYRVGTLKHSAEDESLDKPGSDTWRHAEAGAHSSAIISTTRTAIFHKHAMTIQKAVDALGSIDYLVIEGFKSLDLAPRIAVPRASTEIESLKTGLEIAIVDTGNIMVDNYNIPVFKLSDADFLTDTVEKMAFPLLSGLNCKTCGYSSCRELGMAILRGESTYEKCVKYHSNIILKVDGTIIPMNSFVQLTFKNVIKGLVKSLKDAGESKRIEIEIEDDKI